MTASRVKIATSYVLFVEVEVWKLLNVPHGRLEYQLPDTNTKKRPLGLLLCCGLFEQGFPTSFSEFFRSWFTHSAFLFFCGLWFCPFSCGFRALFTSTCFCNLWFFCHEDFSFLGRSGNLYAEKKPGRGRVVKPEKERAERRTRWFFGRRCRTSLWFSWHSPPRRLHHQGEPGAKGTTDNNTRSL